MYFTEMQKHSNINSASVGNQTSFQFWVSGILVAGSMIFLSCSAYLNTYYNAENAFREGNIAHQKILKQFPDSIIVAPPAASIPRYDRAIEKSIKVIDVHSKKKKWHDNALFLMGKSYFHKKEMPQAIRRFREMIETFPTSPLVPEAYVYMAKAYIEEDNLNIAEEMITMVLQKYPAVDKNQQVSLLLVEISVRREGRSHAIALLQKALSSAKSEDQRIDLIIRLSELYIQLKQYDKAVALLERAPRKKKYPAQMYRMDKALLVSYIQIDSLERALILADAMIATKLYFKYEREVLLQKGRILKMLGRYDEAISALRKITGNLDSTTVTTDTSKITAQAFYELALIYQKKKADFQEAKSLYKLAAKGKDTVSVAASRKRLSALEMLEKLQNQKSQSPEEKNITILKIGELYKYELDEPDSAYSQFLMLSRDTGAGPEYIGKALCAAAFVARDDMNDTTRSDSLFRIVIRDFPASDFAKISQEQLNEPVTVKTRRDSAQVAYRQAEKLFYTEKDVKGAIRAFFDVYKMYPDQSVAPKSLFAAAWLSDDILHKNRTAKSLYERVCEKYPESVYCIEQAQPRLKIVNDTLQALEAQNKSNDSEQDENPGKNDKRARRSADKSAQKKAVAEVQLEQEQEDSSEPLSVDEMDENRESGVTDSLQETHSTSPVLPDSQTQEISAEPYPESDSIQGITH